MSEETHYQHDPDQTELEKWINAGLNKAEPYTNQILMGFIAATVIAVVAVFWFRSSGEAASAGWSEFVTNEAPDDYAEVAKENPDTAVAVWAKLQAGRLYLNEGLNTALTNRETSDEQLNNAKEAFNGVLDNKMAPAPAREGALYGLASALEALSDSDTGPAIKAYEALLEEFPESTHAPWAKTRIEELKTGEAQEFYAWFRKQNLELPDRPKPNDVNTPGTSLLDNLKLTPEDDTSTPAKKDGPQAPDLPEGTEKKPADDTKPAEMKPEDKSETPEKPADPPKTEEKSAAEEKPASEKPAADDKPKTEEKPAEPAKPEAEEPKTEEKSATDKPAEVDTKAEKSADKE